MADTYRPKVELGMGNALFHFIDECNQVTAQSDEQVTALKFDS